MNPTLKHIYANLPKEKLLAELHPETSGDHLILTCPACGKREAFLYLNSHIIICNRRDNCGYQKSLWDWTQNRYNYSNKETIAHLARLAGVTLSEEQGTNRDPERLLITNQKACQNALHEIPENSAIQYLREKRKWSDEEIYKSGIGFHPGNESLTATLSASHSKEEIESLPLIATKLFSTRYRLIIPYHHDGALVGFIGRLTEEHPDHPKYRFPKNTKVNLVNFEPAHEVTIVEGILDSVLAHVRGIPNVFASCTNQLNGTQLATLTANRNIVNRIRLLFDNDPAGRKGTFTSIVKLLGDGFTDIRVGELPPEYKDLEEYLSKTKATTLDAISFIPYYEWLGIHYPTTNDTKPEPKE